MSLAKSDVEVLKMHLFGGVEEKMAKIEKITTVLFVAY